MSTHRDDEELALALQISTIEDTAHKILVDNANIKKNIDKLPEAEALDILYELKAEVDEIQQAHKLALANKKALANKLIEASKRTKTDKGVEGTSTPPMSWKIIDTPGDYNLCGFYAVIGSLKAQMPDLPVPTVQDLLDTYNGSEMATRNAASGLTNTDYFGADQVAGTLYEWALLQGVNIQLGCLIDRGTPLLLSTQTSDADNVRVLWIHNDNASELDEKLGNHFSGLLLL